MGAAKATFAMHALWLDWTYRTQYRTDIAIPPGVWRAMISELTDWPDVNRQQDSKARSHILSIIEVVGKSSARYESTYMARCGGLSRWISIWVEIVDAVNAGDTEETGVEILARGFTESAKSVVLNFLATMARKGC